MKKPALALQGPSGPGISAAGYPTSHTSYPTRLFEQKLSSCLKQRFQRTPKLLLVRLCFGCHLSSLLLSCKSWRDSEMGIPVDISMEEVCHHIQDSKAYLSKIWEVICLLICISQRNIDFFSVLERLSRLWIIA